MDEMERTCRWCPEDDDGNLIDRPCGRPARWLSCVPCRSTPTCDEHRCRCRTPLFHFFVEGSGLCIAKVTDDGSFEVVAYTVTEAARDGAVRLLSL